MIVTEIIKWRLDGKPVELAYVREKASFVYYSYITKKWTLYVEETRSVPEQVCSLIHEIGHFLRDNKMSREELDKLALNESLARKGNLEAGDEVVNEEIRAWKMGYRFWVGNNLEIPSCFFAEANRSLGTYLRDLTCTQKTRKAVESLEDYLSSPGMSEHGDLLLASPDETAT